MVTIQETRQQLQQAKSITRQQQQQAESIKPTTQYTREQLGKRDIQERVKNISKESETRQEKEKVLGELKEQEKSLEKSEQEIEQYLTTPSGIVQYAKEENITPKVRYENRVVSVGTGVEKNISVPVYIYETPYGTYEDTSEAIERYNTATERLYNQELAKTKLERFTGYTTDASGGYLSSTGYVMPKPKTQGFSGRILTPQQEAKQLLLAKGNFIEPQQTKGEYFQYVPGQEPKTFTKPERLKEVIKPSYLQTEFNKIEQPTFIQSVDKKISNIAEKYKVFEMPYDVKTGLKVIDYLTPDIKIPLGKNQSISLKEKAKDVGKSLGKSTLIYLSNPKELYKSIIFLPYTSSTLAGTATVWGTTASRGLIKVGYPEIVPRVEFGAEITRKGKVSKVDVLSKIDKDKYLSTSQTAKQYKKGDVSLGNVNAYNTKSNALGQLEKVTIKKGEMAGYSLKLEGGSKVYLKNKVYSGQGDFYIYNSKKLIDKGTGYRGASAVRSKDIVKLQRFAFPERTTTTTLTRKPSEVVISKQYGSISKYSNKLIEGKTFSYRGTSKTPTVRLTKKGFRYIIQDSEITGVIKINNPNLKIKTINKLPIEKPYTNLVLKKPLEESIIKGSQGQLGIYRPALSKQEVVLKQLVEKSSKPIQKTILASQIKLKLGEVQSVQTQTGLAQNVLSRELNKNVFGINKPAKVIPQFQEFKTKEKFKTKNEFIFLDKGKDKIETFTTDLTQEKKEDVAKEPFIDNRGGGFIQEQMKEQEIVYDKKQRMDEQMDKKEKDKTPSRPYTPPDITTGKKIPKILIGFGSLKESSKTKTSSFLKPGYTLKIRRKGKIETIKTGLGKEEALKLGFKTTKLSTVQTFGIKQEGFKTTSTDTTFKLPFDLYTIPKSKRTFITPITFTEKRGKTLTTREEVRSLLSSKKNKRRFFL